MTLGIGTTSFVEDATLDVVMNISDTFGGTQFLKMDITSQSLEPLVVFLQHL